MSAGYVTPMSLRATGYAMIAITTVIAGARLTIAIARPKKFAWDDFWLVLAYIFFLVVSTLYLVAVPTMFRLEDVAVGKTQPYPTILDDSLFIQKIFFVTTSGLWFTLWSVKFSLMALYKRLVNGVKFYIRIWWAIILLSFIFLVGAVTSSMLSCSSMKAWFTGGGCSTARDVKAAAISLWYAFAVDILTDLMIMFLPIFLIWNLQMPMSQKIGVGALFCLGWICIAVAIIRVKELGSTVHNTTPKTTWLALWGIVETSIAVMIGCGPGLYRRVKAVYKTHQASYLSKGYAKQRNGTGDNANAPHLQGHDLPMYGSKHQRTTTTIRGGSRNWDDGASSQEELRGDENDYIKVTKSVNVAVHERAPGSIDEWESHAR